MEWKEIHKALNKLAPEQLACDWDNSGLLAGPSQKEIRKVCIALDASFSAVEYGVKEKCDLLLTHHPLIFRPIKRIDDSGTVEKKLLTLMENRVSLYAMHTNFDSVKGGMADLAAGKLGLKDTRPLKKTEGFPGCGIGRIGNLKEKMKVSDFLAKAKEAFHPEAVGFYQGDKGLCDWIDRVALCPGSGGDMMEEAQKEGAQLYVTGDLKYHAGMDGAQEGLSLLNIDHYSMEIPFVEYMTGWFGRTFPEIETVSFFGENPCRFL